ncbi:hypothetical protein RHMOL_Rhmol01G0115400 [Rhododendron molle]|uniref:Uncharacterized protein n=1 Tax=Rhododendron molle TaxID=49168 RepID=A0ACC0Q1V9_RHOML|nr:hypothetical protein RHMOL_Rhmol01G0115400 [Rhododendron molle]
MDIPNDSSWTTRKILGLRKLCHPLIRYHVGNGANTFLWLDNWHTLGPLYAKFGERVVTNLSKALWAKVATIIDQGDWCWPRLRNQSIQAIMAHTPPNLRQNLNVEDSVSWIPHPSDIFIVRSAWNAIRKRYPIQPWQKIIWSGNAVPRWSFILWLVVLQRLSTKDRLNSWGLHLDGTCSLCNSAVETHQHLFFECSFSTVVWQHLVNKNMVLDMPSHLVEVLDWYGVQVKGKSLRCMSLTSSLAATIYGLWRERNC